MEKKDAETVKCSCCSKTLSDDEVYIFDKKKMCDNCAMKKGMYPLEHTGSRRDRISERGRFLTRPER